MAETLKAVWLSGDRKKGVGIYKVKNVWIGKPNKIAWRVAIWKNGRIYRTEDYPTKVAAMKKAKSIAKDIKKYGWYS